MSHVHPYFPQYFPPYQSYRTPHSDLRDQRLKVTITKNGYFAYAAKDLQPVVVTPCIQSVVYQGTLYIPACKKQIHCSDMLYADDIDITCQDVSFLLFEAFLWHILSLDCCESLSAVLDDCLELDIVYCLIKWSSFMLSYDEAKTWLLRFFYTHCKLASY